MKCKLCGKEIVTKIERYTHVEDWVKEEMQSDMWCHVICYKKAMNRDLTQLEQTAKLMLQKAVNRDLTQLEQTAKLMLQKAGDVYANLPDDLKKQVMEVKL